MLCSLAFHQIDKDKLILQSLKGFLFLSLMDIDLVFYISFLFILRVGNIH